MKIFYFRFLTDLHALRCFEHDFTIFAKCLSVCHTNFVVVLEQKLISWITWNFTFSCVLIVPFKFYGISLKKFWCCLKFLISLTRWCRTKLRAIVFITNYFKLIILKFKTFIYNNNNEIIYNFCMHRGQYSLVGEEVTPRGREFFTIGIFRKNTSKYSKLMVETDVCHYLNQNYRCFSFLTKKFWNSFRNVLEDRLEGNRFISFVHIWL